MSMSWVHCNNCYLVAIAQSSNKRRAFAIASCGHLFCATCRDLCVLGKRCTVCGRSPFAYENVGRHMSDKTKKYFQTPEVLLKNALQNVNSVIKFQQNQYSIMQKNMENMRGELNATIGRYEETAKQCDTLKKNANSFKAIMQNHHDSMQQLNSSFMECAQFLEHFGDMCGENAGSIDLRWRSASRDSAASSFVPDGMSEKSGFSLRNDSVSNAFPLSGGWGENLSNFKTAINKPMMVRPGSAAGSDFSAPSTSVYQQLKASPTSGNLAVVFGAKDWSNALKPAHSINSAGAGYPPTATSGQLSEPTAAMEKDGFLLLQSGNKRHTMLPEDVQLPTALFEMKPNTSRMLSARGHSLSRSPPRKSSRSGDN